MISSRLQKLAEHGLGPNVLVAIFMAIKENKYSKNCGINRTRHESETLVQRYLSIFLFASKFILH